MRKAALICSILLPFFLKADGDTVPAIAVVGAFASIAVVVLLVVLGISYLFKNLTQGFRNELRAHAWWMAMGVLLLPVGYYVVSVSFIGSLEDALGYVAAQILNYLLLVCTVPAGFYAGYFMTSVKKKEEPGDEKKDAKFILLLSWVVCMVALLVYLMRPVLETGHQLANQEAEAQKTALSSKNFLLPRLSSSLKGVIWNEEEQVYKAHTKSGLAVEVGFYQDGYSLFFYRIKMLEPRTGDTLAWKRALEFVYPLVTDKQHANLTTSLANHQYGLGLRYEEPLFYVQMDMGTFEMNYNRDKKWLEIAWSAFYE